MRKVAVMWVCALMLLSSLLLVPAGTGADEDGCAPRAPTMIYNANDLQNMSSGLNGDYALANDIDASATSGWSGGAGFVPVGTGSSRFGGTFDGKGFNITKLTINRGSQDYVGLFGYTQSPAKITNVNLVDASISGRNFVGGIAGYMYYGTISGCSVGGTVKGTGYYVGGLAGNAYYGTIANSFSTGSVSAGSDYCGGIAGYAYQTPVSMCYSTASVSGYWQTGGIVGLAYYGSISTSYFAGSVSGYYFVAGIVGRAESVTISYCYNTGSVTGSSDSTGGIGGFVYGGSVYYCYNTGPVVGIYYTGGLVGLASSSNLYYNYNTGSVNGYYYVGGLAGLASMSNIYYSYSAGFVKGYNNVGGLIGPGSSNVAYCYWDVQASGTAGSYGGTGKTTDEMKMKSTYQNWDLSSIWSMFEGTTYPYLLWRYPAAVLLSGTAYADAGITPLASGVPVLVVDHLGLSVAHFEARTDYAGRYTQMVDSGTIFAAVTKTSVKANSYGREASAQSYTLDIYNKTVFAKAGPGKNIAVKDIEAVTAVFRTDQVLPLSFSDRGLSFPSGVPLITADGTVFETDRNLTATGGADLRFGGKFTQSKGVLLNAGNIIFNSASAVAGNLSLNCTGDIVFREAMGLGGLTIINAKDVLVRDVLSAGLFTQLNGTGVTDFSRGLLDVGSGDASITTQKAVGRIVTGALSLGTKSTDISGFINGASGQIGADKIVLRNNIRIGTHFFDGIDLYKFTPADVTVATEDAPYSVDYQPRDPANETLTWALETEAAWLSMNAATGVLSGTPDNADVGAWAVKVTAIDGTARLSRMFLLEVLNVNDPPVIMTEDVASVIQDATYSVIYEAMDSDPTHDILVWSMETDAGWLRLDENRLHGIPSNGDVGEYWVNMMVSDGLGGTDSHNFSLIVENLNDAPVITVEPLTRALEDAEYRVAFNATEIDDDDTLNWSIVTTAGWLKMDARTGVLSGTPSNADIGSYWVEVMVEDGEGLSDSLGFMLTVVNVNDEPVWASVPADQNLTEGGGLLLDVLATDVDMGDVIKYAISTEPASGVSINPSSGAIRWSVALAGNYVAKLTASDGKATINFTFNINVKALPPPVIPPPNNLPRIETVTVPPVKAGQTFTLRLNGTDTDAWDGRNLTFRLVSGPAGMIVSADGNILWIPAKDQAGSHTVTVALSDGKNTTTTTFTVEVRKPTAVAAQTAGYNEGWLLAMVFLGLFMGVLVAFVLARRPPKAAQPAPVAPPSYVMQAPPPVESPRAPPAEQPKAPAAEPMQSLPPPEPSPAPRAPPQPEPAVERKAPPPDFKP